MKKKKKKQKTKAEIEWEKLASRHEPPYNVLYDRQNQPDGDEPMYYGD